MKATLRQPGYRPRLKTAVGPMALRPGIATGLPFRGCKAAGPAGMPPEIRLLDREPGHLSKDEKHTSRTETPAGKSQNSYPNETYVRFRQRQILSLREYAPIWPILRAWAVGTYHW